MPTPRRVHLIKTLTPEDGDELPEILKSDPPEAPEADDGEEVAETQGAAPVEPVVVSRGIAGRALRSAIRKLTRYDYSSFGLTGIDAAVSMLRVAQAKLEAMPTTRKTPKTIAVGVLVNIREKALPNYEGVLEPDDLTGLRVVGYNGKTVRVTLPSNAIVLLPLRDLEVA